MITCQFHKKRQNIGKGGSFKPSPCLDPEAKSLFRYLLPLLMF